MKRYFSVINIIIGALIAAVYAGLTIVLAPISYSVIQVRVAEALTILPVFFPAAVPGLFIGCIIANLAGGFGIFDIVFGSLATLIAAVLTRLLRKIPLLAPLPPVIVNALIIGYLLSNVFNIGTPFWTCVLWVGLGQALACYGLGLPLFYALKKYAPAYFKIDGVSYNNDDEYLYGNENDSDSV